LILPTLARGRGDVHADEPGDQEGQVKLAHNRFQVTERSGKPVQGKDVAEAESSERGVAEVEQLGERAADQQMRELAMDSPRNLYPEASGAA
jgi:hypothetical protein